MNKKQIFFGLGFFLVILLLGSFESLYSQNQADELAKKLQNPVASLISVPFQNNLDFGFDPADGSRYLLNIQPVIPLSISEDWNLIGRVILPIIAQNDIYGNSGSQFGLGDMVLSGFFSPKEPTSSGLIWGAGPVMLVPIATDRLLGAEKWGVGPTAVFLKQAGSLTLGVLVNHIWSFAGESDRADVNSTFLQPFIAKNFTGGLALSFNTELTQDWEGDNTIGTFNIVGSKVVSLNKQLAQVFLGPRLPYGGGNTSSFGVRFGIVLLFPK